MDSNNKNKSICACLVFIFSILVAACGGGGGGGGASGSPATHTIGGTVTGLVGTLVLQNNGASNLTLTSNGGFTFPGTVPSGSPYSISVLSQPSGPSCTITAPSGTATSNVAASVVCTADPSTFYLPLSVQPATGMTGTTGLYGLSSKELDRAPAPIVSGTTNLTGYSLNFTISSGHLSGGVPFALAFSTVNAAGGDHVFAVDLTANSTLAPRQISSLTFPSNLGVQNCGITTAYGDLTDPNSVFFIIGVPPDPINLCGGGSQGFKRYLVHLSDSPTFPPMELPSLTGTVLPLYQPGGALAGFVMLDASFNLNFYPDQTFTNPKVLLTNVVGFSSIQSAQVSGLMNNLSADPSFAYLAVILPDNSQSLYRVDYTGVLSADLYDSTGEIGGALDSGYLYLTEALGQAGAFYRMPLDGSARPTMLFQYGAGNPYALIGITDSQLVLKGVAPPGSPTIATLPLTGGSTPDVIGTFANNISFAIRSGDVFVTELGLAGSGSTLAPTYLSESLTLDGTVLQPATPQSSFVCCSSNSLIQITNTVGPTGLSAGTVSSISVASPEAPTSTPLKDASGAPFVMSSGVVYANSYDIASTIGYVRAQTDAHYLAYFYDVSKSLMVAVPVDTSDVLVMGVPN
jgi:hypothetical protein